MKESGRKRNCSNEAQVRECRVKVVVSGQAVGTALLCQMPDIDAIPSAIVFESPAKTEKDEGETAGNLAALSTKPHASGSATTSAHREIATQFTARPEIPPGLGFGGHKEGVSPEWMAAITSACAEEAVKLVKSSN